MTWAHSPPRCAEVVEDDGLGSQVHVQLIVARAARGEMRDGDECQRGMSAVLRSVAMRRDVDAVPRCDMNI